jgi:hypothetical protein
MASSKESGLYAKITPTTRLKNVVASLMKARLALQHMNGYDGSNLSDEQLATVMNAMAGAPDEAIAKLEDLRKRVKDFLRKV